MIGSGKPYRVERCRKCSPTFAGHWAVRRAGSLHSMTADSRSGAFELVARLEAKRLAGLDWLLVQEGSRVLAYRIAPPLAPGWESISGTASFTSWTQCALMLKAWRDAARPLPRRP